MKQSFYDWKKARAKFKDVVNTGSDREYESALAGLINAEVIIAEITGLPAEVVASADAGSKGVAL